MIKVYFIRHGETEWNRIHRLGGISEAPLNETGIEQARRVAERLKDETLTAIYSSTLSRAYDTACAIAQHHDLEVTKVHEVREISLGDWEGMLREEVMEQDPELFEKWRVDAYEVCTPNGECGRDVRERALPALDSILEQHTDGDVLAIVAHGGTLSSILSHYLDVPFWEPRHSNTGVSIVEYDKDEVRVIAVNDDSHILDL